jgi:hypothetical protein
MLFAFYFLHPSLHTHHYLYRDVVGPQGEIFGPLTSFLQISHSDPETHLQAIETLNIIFSRGNEPLIRALYPFAVPSPNSTDIALVAPEVNVYVSCMNNLSSGHFENIWGTFMRWHGDAEDLTTLLFQVTMAAGAGSGVADSDPHAEEIAAKQRAAAASIVTEQRTRRRILADLKMMLETYLFEQARAKQSQHSQQESRNE